MTRNIEESFVIKTDEALISAGIKLHQRPFHVVTAWMKANGIAGNLFDEVMWVPLMEIYRKLYPSGDFSMPGMFEGGVALRDRMYKVRINVGFGTFRVDPIECIDIPRSELEFIFRHYPDQGWRAIYGVADLWDFAYGVDDLARGEGDADMLLKNARSSIAATARILMADLDIDAAVQSACLASELALKGALAVRGWSEEQYRRLSHKLDRLADALIGEVSTLHDARLRTACSRFPDYVGTRYASHGLTRIELMALAMRAQFVAAEAVRRVCERNFVGVMEADQRNPPRQEI